MYANLNVAARECLHGNSIIKVFSIGRIDGKGGDTAEVATLFCFFCYEGRSRCFEGVRLFLNLLRGLKGETFFEDDGTDFCLVFADITDDLNNFCGGILLWIGPFEKLN